MDAEKSSLYAVVEIGKTIEALPVLSSTKSHYVLASGAGMRQSKVERRKVFFVTQTPLGRQDVKKAFSEARQMEYGSLWEASSVANTLDGMATCLKGVSDDMARLLVACAYFGERPLFAARAGELFTPIPAGKAERIIQSKREILELNKQDAALMARIGEGDLSMVKESDIDPILFEKGFRLGRIIERHGAKTREDKVALLLRSGLLSSEFDYHRRSVIHELIVHPSASPALDGAGSPPPALDNLNPVSCDQEGTTEIDDAISIEREGDDSVTLRAHLCSPICRILPGGDLDALAQERMSTVYMPQEKCTMLPADVCRELTLAEGQERAVITVGVKMNIKTGKCTDLEPGFETARIARNSYFRGFSNSANLADLGVQGENEANVIVEILRRHREAPSNPLRRRCGIHIGEDGNVKVEGGVSGLAEDIVSEMMILSNSRLARFAYEGHVPLIYRGKGCSALAPKRHPEVGHDVYGWFSSPLRRYVDLVNQRQIASLLGNGPDIEPLSKQKLSEIAETFDRRYAQIMLAQRNLERFWTLRHVKQESESVWDAQVVRDDVVMIGALQLRGKLAGSRRAQGDRLKVRAEEIDLISLSVKFAEVQ